LTILDAIPEGYVLNRPGEHGRNLDMQELLNRVREDLHPGQRAFVDDCSTQIIGMSAGYGAGKTRALAAKTLFMAAANQGFTGCVMEPTGPLIRDIWMNDFEEFLEAYEVPYTFRASPLPEYILHLPQATQKFCAGALRTGRGLLVSIWRTFSRMKSTLLIQQPANEPFPKSWAVCALATCVSSLRHQHLKVSVGCGKRSVQRRPFNEAIGSL